MKGAPGIVVALLLGLVAVVLNWIYLENKTKDVDSISFLGIRDGKTINPGEPFQHQHFMEIKIPARHARNLKDVVYSYKDVNTIVGTRATRAYQGGELIGREDYVTPAAELVLEKDEFLFWVPVDAQRIVPELITPGDRITFEFPAYAAEPAPELAAGGGSDAALRAGEPGVVGPFRVKTLGNRLGRVDVLRASRRSSVQEQKIGIVIDETSDEEMARFQQLRELEKTVGGDFSAVSVRLHGD